MTRHKPVIIGGGMTGLAAGMVSGLKVYEAEAVPGGICSSYYMTPGSGTPMFKCPEDENVYRFEIGGGHWIFGGDPTVLRFISSMTPVRLYHRSSAVYFSKQDLYVPYPIQNNLGYLGKEIAKKALNEIESAPDGVPRTMSDWIDKSFGKTLTELFFAPFHELYTAGLWTEIAPQDAYKSPINIESVRQGAFDKVSPAVGYNVTYLYPESGLNTLSQCIAERCDIEYDHRASKIDLDKKEIQFQNGDGTKYEHLISTLPLNKALEMSGIEIDDTPSSYTSVLVLNIGATKGPKCPNEHWLYIPDSESGFHRVGFYSNVDPSFLPLGSRANGNRVSIYVERAYQNGRKPSDETIKSYMDSVVGELKSWEFIEEAETVDPTWIDVAYTWSMPGSNWKELALSELEKKGVYQIGRYGRWMFQGIAESLKDGFIAGGAFKE